MKNESNIKQEGYHSSAHLKFLCRYHVIFCPKYRRKVLVNGIDIRLKEVFSEIAQDHGFAILEMEVMPDYVHLLIDCNPRYGIMQCVTDLKWGSAHVLNAEYPQLNIQQTVPETAGSAKSTAPETGSCLEAMAGTVRQHPPGGRRYGLCGKDEF